MCMICFETKNAFDLDCKIQLELLGAQRPKKRRKLKNNLETECSPVKKSNSMPEGQSWTSSDQKAADELLSLFITTKVCPN